jgi:hypothetical protein
MILDTEIYEKAAHDAAILMTRDLRRHARKDGLPREAAKGIDVKYGETGFKVNISGEHADTVWKHEYGTESQTPRATIRKYANKKKGNNLIKNSLVRRARESG